MSHPDKGGELSLPLIGGNAASQKPYASLLANHHQVKPISNFPSAPNSRADLSVNLNSYQ